VPFFEILLVPVLSRAEKHNTYIDPVSNRVRVNW